MCRLSGGRGPGDLVLSPCVNTMDRKDSAKTLSIQDVLAKLLPSHVTNQPIRNVIELLGWVGLDTSGSYKDLGDRLAEHLKQFKHLASSRQAGANGKGAVYPFDAKEEEKKKKKSRVVKVVSRLSKAKLEEIGRNARRCEIHSIHQDVYLKLMEIARSAKPDVLNLVLLLAQCELAMLITRQLWSTLIDIFLLHADMGATALDSFTAGVNTLVRQTTLFPELFAQLTHALPSAFVSFFCPQMVHFTINHFFRFCEQNGIPSSTSEPVPDEIVYSPDDEAVLVGWVLHSIIRVMYSRLDRVPREKKLVCEGVIAFARQLHFRFPVSSSFEGLRAEQLRAERVQRGAQFKADFLRPHNALTTASTPDTTSSTAAVVTATSSATTASTHATTTTAITTSFASTVATSSRNVLKLDLDSPGMRFFCNLNQGGLKLPVPGLLALAALIHTVWARRVLQKKKNSKSFIQAHADIISDAKVGVCYQTLCSEQVPPPTKEVQVLFLSKFISKWTHVRQGEYCAQLSEQAGAQNQNLALRAMVLMSQKRRVPRIENSSSVNDSLDPATADMGLVAIAASVSDSGSSSDDDDQPQLSLDDMMAIYTQIEGEEEEDA